MCAEFEPGRIVRIRLARWLREHEGPWDTAERAHRHGMIGRIGHEVKCNVPGHIRVDWINPPARSTWTFTEAPTDFFQLLSPLELLAWCELLAEQPE